MNKQLSRLLYPLGITAKYTGYYYISYAVELVAAEPSRLIHVTKDLYPSVAAHFSSTVSRVERNLRLTADTAWHTNPQLLQELAGYRLLQRPCPSQLIAILSAEYRKTLTVQVPGDQLSLF